MMMIKRMMATVENAANPMGGPHSRYKVARSTPVQCVNSNGCLIFHDEVRMRVMHFERNFCGIGKVDERETCYS